MSTLARRVRRRLKAQAEDDDATPLDGLRARAVVGGMFLVAPRVANPKGLKKLDGAVEWRITRPDGGATLRTMVFDGESLKVRRHVLAEPDLTLVLTASDFFRLAMGATDAVSLMSKGRIMVFGDLDFGMRLPKAFGRR